jgi:hypothetical protein
MFTEETTQNQNGQNTEVAVPQQNINIEDFLKAIELAKTLKEKARGVSIVPKIFEFTTSVAMVESNASKLKDKEREAYITQNMPFTSTIGFFQGTVEELVDKVENLETGEVRTQEKRFITRWINEDGLWISLGVQLARCCKFIEKGTPVEIVYIKDEPVKSKAGAVVKIYEVYPLI